MSELPPSPTPSEPPHGAAFEHARGASGWLGGLAGGAAGAIFGGLWGFFSKQGLATSTLISTIVGASTGFVFSRMTWDRPMNLPAPTPEANPDFLAPATQHAARIAAERDASPTAQRSH